MIFLVSRDEELRIESFDSAWYELSRSQKLDKSGAGSQYLRDRKHNSPRWGPRVVLIASMFRSVEKPHELELEPSEKKLFIYPVEAEANFSIDSPI